MTKRNPSVTVADIENIEKGTSVEFKLRDVKDIFSVRNTLYYVRSINKGNGNTYTCFSDKEKPSITITVS